MATSFDIVICGAGIAGVSSAYHLAVRHGLRNILLVDERPALTLTTDNSAECYRNWWPGPGDAMVALMNRSIDLMEELAAETGNIFRLNRRGYLYLTADKNKIPEMKASARQVSQLGGGPLRILNGSQTDPEYLPPQLEGYQDAPPGADLLLDGGLIHKYYPYLTEDVVAALHVRRAGWFSAQQLGMYLLEKVRAAGVRQATTRLCEVNVQRGKITGVKLSDGAYINTGCLVNAAGPSVEIVGQMLGIDLPVFHELHQKVAFQDSHRVVDRTAPLLIWNDSQNLPWSAEEVGFLSEDPKLSWLLNQMPSGVHTRPEGGSDSQILLLLWEYHTEKVTPTWPIRFDPQYPEIVLRGLIRMLPGLQIYLDRGVKPLIDGGYYTKTKENRPIIGELPVEGAFIIGALSGFGLMSSCAAGELLAAHVSGGYLPGYAPAFSLQRYSDPTYLHLLDNWGASGQL